jgi:hypothetical protein
VVLATFASALTASVGLEAEARLLLHASAYLEVVEVLSGARALRDYRDLYAR